MPTPTPTSTLTPLATLPSPSTTRAWHTNPHPTSPLLATTSSDKTVRIYNLATNALHSTITGGHKRSIRCSAWKPNLKGESVLATGSFDASVGIWRRWDEAGGGMVPRPEEDMNVGGGEGEGGEEEEEDEWRFAIVLDGHDSEVKSVAWSAGGNLLATCSRDKSVWVWEEVGEDDFETVAVLQEHEGDVKCVAWHPEEELLASASYDDEIRLWREEIDDWGCCAVLRRHTGTVWCVQWEGVKPMVYGDRVEGREGWLARREKSGPRLLSCSDDRSVRVWRRVPRERVEQSRLSIIKSGSGEEEWVEEALLPVAHERTVYAVAWSARSGRIVSTGGDGAVVVYQEEWIDEAVGKGGDGEADMSAQEGKEGNPADGVEEVAEQKTRWTVMARIEAAHGVFEVNHVAWAKKPVSKTGTARGEEEVIITTGDDGAVKVWALNL